MDTVRVLLVSDAPSPAVSPAWSALGDDPRTAVVAETGDCEALDALAGDAVDVDCVVAERDLSDEDALSVLERVRGRRPALPFVVVAENGSEAAASEAISAGVTDYVPVDSAATVPDRVVEAVRGRRRGVDASVGRETGKRLFRDLLDRSNDAVLIAEFETGRYVDANETARRRLGYEWAELDALTVLDVEATFDDETDWREHAERVKREGTVVNEGRHRRKDGTTFPVELTIDYVNHDGREFVIAIARDITVKRQREKRLERQNERLEQFASFVSHDLRTPLVTADGFLDLLVEKRGLDGVDEAAKIREAHERMDGLIENFLSFARENSTDGTLEPVSIREAATSAWGFVDTGVDPDCATFRCPVDQTVRADASQLQQIFENLFRNALEHGTSPVTVEVGTITDDDGRWRGFFVADDGRGIPEDRREEITDPGVTTSDSGTGFGLAIVSDIADAHSWSVSVADSDAGGARIEIVTEPSR
jgi:PAS domain S-box-containing protein